MTPESQSPPAKVSREQAVAAAKRIELQTKLFGDECRMTGQVQASVLDDAETLAAYVLQFTPAEAFDATCFLRNVLSQGGAIQQDYADKPYDEYARRLDCASVELTAELSALIAAQGRAGDEWWPIDMAPKDGTHILIGWQGSTMTAISRWLKTSQQWLVPTTTAPVPLNQPTHFHPMPKPLGIPADAAHT